MVFRPFESTINLVRKLLDVGVATAVYSLCPGGQQLLKSAGIEDLFGVCVDGIPAASLVEATRQLGVRPQRSVVVDDAGAGIAAAQDGGFALVIGVDRAGNPDRLLGCGADVVVADLEDVAVRAGDRRISAAPRCGGVIRSDNRCPGCPRADVVSRLRRNACPPSFPIPAPPPSSRGRLRRWKAWRRNAPSPY